MRDVLTMLRQRIIDNIPRVINHGFLRATAEDMHDALVRGLGLGADRAGAWMDAETPWASGGTLIVGVASTGGKMSSGFGACIDSDNPPLLRGASIEVELSGVSTGGTGFRGTFFESASMAPTGLAGSDGCRGAVVCFSGDFLT